MRSRPLVHPLTFCSSDCLAMVQKFVPDLGSADEWVEDVRVEQGVAIGSVRSVHSVRCRHCDRHALSTGP